MPTATKPNTREQGFLANVGNVLTWGQMFDELEFSPDLRWPASVWVYNKMDSSDAQLRGLMAGTVNPMTRFRWSLEPQDAKPEVLQKLSNELKLPIKGKEDEFILGRTKGRFTWKRHLPDALKFLIFGHYPFERVFEVDEQKYGDDLYHIKSISPRPPYTLSQINVLKNGDLAGIKQYQSNFAGASQWNTPGIEANALLWYVWEKEGANWAGRSVMRSCFRNYVIKDMLLRVDATKHERVGLGTPWFEAPEGASQQLIDQLDELAQQFRAGLESGGAGPHGAKLRLVGVEGNMPDTVASITMHNEEMAKAFLMMFMQLGTTKTGSKALGEEMIDYFSFAQEAYADRIAETFTEGIIEDWVTWNYGEDEPAPRIVYDRSQHEDPPTEDLAMMAEKGLIVMDPELESYIRKSRNLPLKSEAVKKEEQEKKEAEDELEIKKAEQTQAPALPAPGETTPPAPEPAKASSGRRRSDRVAAESEAPSPTLNLPDRQLRRQPYPQEIAAKVDFARIETDLATEEDTLFSKVKELQASQVEELHAKIAEATTLEEVASLSLEGNAHESIAESMKAMGIKGIEEAADEASSQGVTDPVRPDIGDLESTLTARAKAVDDVLTRELASAGVQKASTLWNDAIPPAEVADKVKDYLDGLVKARVKGQLGGALHAAQNTGRRVTIKRNAPSHIYSSEILDTNTCTSCTAEDGKEFGSMEEAELSYPTGGYAECQGGDSCRGTLIATYGEEENSGTGE